MLSAYARTYLNHGDVLGTWRIFAKVLNSARDLGAHGHHLCAEISQNHIDRHADYLTDMIRVAGIDPRKGLKALLDGTVRVNPKLAAGFYHQFCRQEQTCRDYSVLFAPQVEIRAAWEACAEKDSGDAAHLNALKAIADSGVKDNDLVKIVWRNQKTSLAGNEFYELGHQLASEYEDSVLSQEIVEAWANMGECPRYGDVYMRNALEESGIVSKLNQI